MNDGGALFFGGFLFFWLLIIVVGLGGLALSIWMIVDAAQRPDYQFQATGQNKVLWIVLGVVGIAVCQLAGLIAGPIYLFSVRKRLAAAPAPVYGYPAYGAGYAPAPGAYPGWGAYPAPGPPAYPAPGQAPPAYPTPQPYSPAAEPSPSPPEEDLPPMAQRPSDDR